MSPGGAAPRDTAGSLVSVVIPCRDHARYLPTAVSSVRAQTHATWECIIVDDGSVDDSAAVAAELAAGDARFRVRRQRARGLAGARNAGLRLARGEYVQFLDADDVILPPKLATQLAVLATAPEPALAYCDYYITHAADALDDRYHATAYLPPRLEDDQPLLDLARRWEATLSIPAHCFLFDRRLFTDHAIRFDERLPTHEDWDCWMEILRRKPVIRYVDAKLAVYRRNGPSMSSNRVRMRRGFLRALRNQRRQFRADPVMAAALAAKLAEVARAYADCAPSARMGRILGASLRHGGRLVPAPLRRRVAPLVQAWLARRGWERSG